MVVIVLIGILSVVAYTAFINSFYSYLSLQKDGFATADIAANTQRIASVVRGVTSITYADKNELKVTAYFAPADQYLSECHYYLVDEPDGTQKLMADVTPYDANPPIGTLQTSEKRTYTIIPNYYSEQVNPAVFTYYSISDTPLSVPVQDLNVIKQIAIRLSAKGSLDKSWFTTVQVSLRNRKTNL